MVYCLWFIVLEPSVLSYII